MLISNLSVLLAQRDLTISKLSEDTRLSRTTLTALTTRAAKGIQFDTLNTLCQYLKIEPGELFLYLPFDLELSVEDVPPPLPMETPAARATAEESTHSSLYWDAVIACQLDGQVMRSRVTVTSRRAGGPTQRCLLDCDAEYRTAPGPDGAPRLESLLLKLSLPELPEPVANERNAELVRRLRTLPRPALAHLELQLLRHYDTPVTPDRAPADYTPALLWPWE